VGEAGLSFAALVREGGLVVCGKASQPLLDLAGKRNLVLIQLLSDEAFTMGNAIITAEVAIGLAVLDAPMALVDMTVAITGGGRIAQALAGRLIALGAKVRLIARSETQREAAISIGASAYGFPAGDHLEDCDVLFNTAPSLVVTESDLSKLPSHAILYELASQSGFPAEAAASFGLKAVLALALPGKYSPMSAARLILNRACELAGERLAD
jgi:dipicolinate synthase subunit A